MSSQVKTARRKPRLRVHREWFRTIQKTVCPTCGSGDKRFSDPRINKPTTVLSWGEYVYGKWHTVMHFCQHCFPTEVEPKLADHVKKCGCSFEFVARDFNIQGENYKFLSDALERINNKCQPAKE